MKRLTKFQEAQLAYAVNDTTGSLDRIALKAGNGFRYFRNGFWDTVVQAFVKRGLASKIVDTNRKVTYYVLNREQAKDYIDRYNCTSDSLYLDRQPLTAFDKAQLRHLYEHGKMTTYPLHNYSKRGYTYPRLKETLIRLYNHNLISSSWFGSWTNLGADTLTDEGRAYVETHDIDMSPLD